MYVDVHNHYLPEPYVDRLLNLGGPVGLESTDEGLYMVHQRAGTASVKTGNRLPLNEGFTDLDARVAWMDDHDVDTETSVRSVKPSFSGSLFPVFTLAVPARWWTMYSPSSVDSRPTGPPRFRRRSTYGSGR
jgi:hypothetical protein